MESGQKDARSAFARKHAPKILRDETGAAKRTDAALTVEGSVVATEYRLVEYSTAYGIRTRVTGVKGQRPRPLDERGRYVSNQTLAGIGVTEGT